MNNWSETYRGAVPPWECDITEHFTIAYYLDRLTDAERNLADLLNSAICCAAAGFTAAINLRFIRELRAGSSFHIEGRRWSIDGGLRLGHRFVDSANGAIGDLGRGALGLSGVTLLAGRRDAIASRLAAWEGPAIEERPEPSSRSGFLVTARGRVKPGDLDADGRLGSAAIVLRFTDARCRPAPRSAWMPNSSPPTAAACRHSSWGCSFPARCRSTNPISSKPGSRISAIRRCASFTS